MKPSLKYSLMVASIAVIGVLSFKIVALPTKYISSDNAHNLQSILSNILASVVFLFIIDFGSHVLLERSRRQFRNFFGDIANPGVSRLIHPEFALSEECEKALTGLEPGTRFVKLASDSSIRRYVDIPHIVSSNDLFGLIIFTTGFGSFMKEPPQLISDSLAVKGLEGTVAFSFISFGLTSNEITYLYLEMDNDPLFKIVDPIKAPTLIIGNKEYKKESDHQPGLILRYRPDPQNYPNQYWFICAGLHAVGTPAAAWHLVHNWKKYSKKYKTEDFIVVFKTSNNMAGYRTQTDVVDMGRTRLKLGVTK